MDLNSSSCPGVLFLRIRYINFIPWHQFCFFKRQIIHRGNIYYLNPDLNYRNVMRWPSFCSHVSWCYGISYDICTRKKFDLICLKHQSSLCWLIDSKKAESRGWKKSSWLIVFFHVSMTSLPWYHRAYIFSYISSQL